MARVIDAVLTLKDNFSSTLKSVGTQIQQQERIQKRMSKSIQDTGKSISDVSSKMALMSAPLIGFATAGLKMSSDFENGLAKVSTLVDTTLVDMNKLKQGLIKVSNETGVAVTDLSEATYQAISAGVDASKAVEFVANATRSSKAGFTDASTAINGLTTVLNAYGLKADEASKISDQMLIAQNLGKTTFGEMAQSMGNVIPIASSLNISTEELFSSIATLTKNGIATSESVTGLKAAYSNILKPSKQAADMAEQLGLNFNSAHLKSVGWAKFLQEVKEKVGDNDEKMAQLFGSTEALNSVMVLAGKGSKDFANSLDAMKNSAGSTQEAYNKMLTPAEQSAIALNQLKNAGMELSVGLTPILKTTTLIIKQLADTLNNMTPQQKELLMQTSKFVIISTISLGVLGKVISMYGSLHSIVISSAAGIKTAGSLTSFLRSKFTGLITVFKVLGTAIRFLFMNPLGVAITALVVGAYLIYTKWEKIKIFFTNIWNVVIHSFNSAVKTIQAYLNNIGFTEKSSKIVNQAKQLFELLKTIIQKKLIDLKVFINQIVKPIADTFTKTWDSIAKNTKLLNTVSAIVSNVMSIVTAALKTGFKIAYDVFLMFSNNTKMIILRVMDVLSGIITFLTGVFTGDWGKAWQGIVEVFSAIFNTIKGICMGVMSTVKAIINDAITGVNNVNIKIPEWVPLVGGQQYSPNIPMLAKGTDNWQGGYAMIHDAGAEIVDLPHGTRVIPHDKSLQEARKQGQKETKQGITITMPKLAETIIVREESDIDKIVEKLAFKLKTYAVNQMEGAV